MTFLHLVRHGETVWHTENRYAGVSDVALTDRGHAQAERLGRWASQAELSAVLCSDLSRAVATATPAASAAACRLDPDPRWREVDFGAGEGRTRAEMAELFGPTLAAFLAAPASSPLPGGERGRDAVARAWPALTAAVDDHPEGGVLVVGHSTLTRLLLCTLLGLDPDGYRRCFPVLRNAAVTTLRLPTGDPTGRAALLTLNQEIGDRS